MRQLWQSAGLGLVLALALAGCGGGGGGDGGEGGDAAGAPESSSTETTGAPPVNNNPAETGDPAPAAGPAAPAAAADITCGLPNFRADALRLINQRRAAGATCGSNGYFPPTTALAWNDRLTAAAYGHSREMATYNYFSHRSRDGRTMSDRVTAAGYTWSAVGENIAAGQQTVAAAVDSWMKSAGHCASIMSARYRDMGLACASSSSSDYGRYWTFDVARPR
ncbi:CAP domain-containing protein [Caldimonas brevitalea]|uniref:Transmembrane protein n=1 Tax=Caldimonas brevitalea TaxID=413882 RepID=A0A0G3BFZ8_9BURK|nr:CAP domain-containing protein [Caldimonas brevitalea]AKJ26878.1 transmembrane protein [Caldimonas brevitalea]